jgi:Holliday junction resolvase RusA-like endonuclease
MKDTMEMTIVKPRAKKQANKIYLGPDLMHYTIEGPPIPLKRAGRHGTVTYDSQKQIKYSAGIQLKFQHEGQALFDGPLKLEVTFFMPIPQHLQRTLKNLQPHSPHHVKPDVDNLVKFVLDVANTILYHDDALISIIHAQKVYSSVPRTEFSITRLEPCV